MSAPRVTVVGGCGVGFVFGVPRFAERGESILADELRIMSGGKAANQAIGAAVLGARSSLISAVGRDELAETALGVMKRVGVNTSAIVEIDGAATMIGTVEVEPSGDNRITIAPGALARLSAADVERFEELIAGSDVCLVSLEIPLEPALAALAIARRHGVRTVLNPAPAPRPEDARELLPHCDLVTPNETEAATMTAGVGAAALLEAGAKSVALTRGSDGVLVLDGEERREIPAERVENVVDTSGAGDAFNAALAVALARGEALDDAVRAGTHAAALICRGPGFVDALHLWEGSPL